MAFAGIASTLAFIGNKLQVTIFNAVTNANVDSSFHIAVFC